MAKLTADDFGRAVASALGARLVTLLLYGSAARGAHVPGRSDVNTLLLCDGVDDDVFARLEPPVRAWSRAGHPAPLILTEREWRESADVFPIEYQDIRDAHRILAGRDPWAGIVVQHDDLRRQLEQELMGKLTHLRQVYAAHRSEPKRLAEVIVGSASGFLTMLRAALRLAGKPAPAAPDALLREAADAVGFPVAELAPLVAHAGGGPALKVAKHDPLPAAYLEAVARTAQFVNRMERTRS